jgi:hypothetical protein
VSIPTGDPQPVTPSPKLTASNKSVALNPEATMATTEARELELYATNVESWIAPVIKTLSKKHRAGIFDYGKAINYVDRYCLTPAAKQYRLEFGGMTDRWSDLFPKVVRQEAAQSIVDNWVAEFRLGNYWD